MEAQVLNVPSDIDIAYAAGFFDGEGCVSISKNGAIDIRITNTAKNVLVKLQTNFGGSITNRTQKINKTQYAYSLYGEEAISFLNSIKPYCIDKLPQINTILEYYIYREELDPIRIPGKRGAHKNPDREVLVRVFRDILTELKHEEH